MGFNSIEFLIFFPVVAVLYFVLPHRVRWAWLLACSYCFYMFWHPAYILLLLASTLIDYLAGLLLGRSTHGGLRRTCVAASLAGNLGMLAVFKYWNFFMGSLDAMDLAAGPLHNLLLPIGLSFYTFQSLSYTFDVYRGDRAPESHFGRFALYVAFFPQLVAGPIERSTRLLPQFVVPQSPDYGRIADGLKRMAWGFFKKLVIADQLGRYVDLVYGDPTAHAGLPIWIATYAFAFQIYCDFSAYTDIAIGAARVLGIRLMENFRHPYGATSVRDFWRRWHISLSTWFRDYLYVPLGGSRRGVGRLCLNLLVVFVLAGLWHGANETFLVWGLLHAGYLLAGRLVPDGVIRWAASAFGRWVAALLTFHLVCIGWVLFRAESLGHAGEVFRSALTTGALPQLAPGLWVAFLMLGVMHVVERIAESAAQRAAFFARPAWQRWICYYALGAIILIFGRSDPRMFIYFQF